MATGDDDSTDTVCHDVTVNNVDPTVTLTGATSADEGDTVGYSYTVSDPGADTFTLSSESCGVGGNLSNSTFDGTTGAGSFDCTFPDGPATPDVSVTVDDDDGGSGSIAVTVSNVDPTIESLTVPWEEPVDINDQASFSVAVTFSDPAGVNDELYTCAFDLDDDGVDDTTDSGVTGTSCSAVLNYAEPGVYTVKVIVTDKDGGSGSAEATEFIVIYDPDGGFVTGGGWIMSPEGAYAADPSLTGKANFGFVSKYKKGASVPTGQTQFKAGDLNFHSGSYDWLVIAGANAKYNGEGNYGFMLTATDADLTPSTDVDLFRIKIWDKDNGDEVVYDNKMGELGNFRPKIDGKGNIGASLTLPQSTRKELTENFLGKIINRENIGKSRAELVTQYLAANPLDTVED